MLPLPCFLAEQAFSPDDSFDKSAHCFDKMRSWLMGKALY
jgi:hypothetical protein